jgi:predicted acylesterase/phospholipase RssA
LYDDIKVISGTSGGSIAAACCAMYTTKEIEQDICVPTVSTDFRLNGEMKRRNIRWFPPMADMMSYWFKHRLLVDSEVCVPF